MVLVLSLMALTGCIKPTPPATAEPGLRITVVALAEGAGAAEVVDTPARFDSSILDVLALRGLTAELVEGGRLGPVSAARESSLRVERLRGDFAEGAMLLVETRPGYYAEMNGQYRWVVGVTLTLSASQSRPNQTVEFDVPVFLRYHHQREADAVDAAGGVVARRVGELADDWLRAAGG